MMNRTTAAALVCLAGLSACAKSPSAIPPVSMGNAFANTSCAQARAHLTAEQANLGSLSAAQKSAVAGDAIGVFLIGVPVSSLSGNDRAGDIGASKGKVIALESRLQSC